MSKLLTDSTRRLVALGSLILVICGSSGIAAEDRDAARAKGAPTEAEIQRWVAALGADQFMERAAATQKLAAAGLPAIDPVAAAVERGDLEVQLRGIRVLLEIALSHEETGRDAALKALERLATNTETTVGRHASQTLSSLGRIRQQRAIDELRSQGAKIHVAGTEIGRLILSHVLTVEIDEDFKGDERALARLRWLTEAQQVVLAGKQVKDSWLEQLKSMESLRYLTIKRASVSDAGMAHLKDLPNLQRLNILYCPITDRSAEHFQELDRAISSLILFGTEITPAGAEKLEASLERVDVDYREGAFLGIGGGPHPLGFMISTVHGGSAAAREGLEPGDVIVSFDNRKVFDFESLTKLIGKNRPGDTVTVEFLRAGNKVKKQIKLGAWE
jgi:hypothetical protein